MDLLRIAWLDARNANQAKSSRIRSSDQTHEMLKYRACEFVERTENPDGRRFFGAGKCKKAGMPEKQRYI